MIEAPQRNSLVGEPYWGPGNTIHGQSTTELDPLNTLARRHDWDIQSAIQIKHPATCERELRAADERFRERVLEYRAQGLITATSAILSRLGIGEWGAQRIYYQMLKNPQLRGKKE